MRLRGWRQQRFEAVLAALALACARLAFAEGPLPALSVEWVCPHSYGDVGVPQEEYAPGYRQFSFPIDCGSAEKKKEGTLDLSSFNALLVPATQSHVDYFSCLNQFHKKVVAAARDTCAPALPQAGTLYPFYGIDQSLNALGDRIASLPVALTSVPPIVPFAPVTSPSDPQQTRWMKEFFERKEKEMSDPHYCGERRALRFEEWQGLMSQEFVSEYLPRVFASLDQRTSQSPELKKYIEDCKSRLLQSYVEALRSLQRPEEQCPDKTEPRCARLKQWTAALLDRLGTIKNEADKPFLDQERTIFNRAALCILSGADPFATFAELQKQANASLGCVAPSAGQSEPVWQSTVVGGSYVLKRLAPSQPPHFEAKLNLNFYVTGLSREKNQKRDREMKRLLKQCYAKYQPMLWQKNGEHLELSIMDEKEQTRYFYLRHDVSLDTTDRANSQNWPDLAGFDLTEFLTSYDRCKEVMHETMHLLGLVDEYRERWRGLKLDPKKRNPPKAVKWGADLASSDCRVLGPKDSLMSDQYAAIERATKKKEPLLSEAQWRLITEPGCENANHCYKECSQRAYLTSLGHGGTGCDDPLPACCTLPRWQQ